MRVAELKTSYGRFIKAYNQERTICDIIRNRNNMDITILNEAIKRYKKHIKGSESMDHLEELDLY